MASRFFIFDISTKEVEEELNRLLGERTRKSFFSDDGEFKVGGASEVIGRVFENVLEKSFFRQNKNVKHTDASGKGDFNLSLENISSGNLRKFIQQLINMSPLTSSLLDDIKNDVFDTGEAKATFFKRGKGQKAFVGSNKITSGSVNISSSSDINEDKGRLQEAVDTIGRVKGLTNKKDIIKFIVENTEEIQTEQFRELFIQHLDENNSYLNKIKVLFLPITFKTVTNRTKTLGVAVNTTGLITKKDLSLEIENRKDREGITFKVKIKGYALDNIIKTLEKDLLNDINNIDFSSELKKAISKNPDFIGNLLNNKQKGNITIGLIDRDRLQNIITSKMAGKE